MLLVIFAAGTVAAFAGAFAHAKSHDHEKGINNVRCVLCNGSGFQGNFNCAACKGSGRNMAY